MRKKSLIKFPCSFPIKIIGHNHEHLKDEIIEIIKKHAPELNDECITFKTSEGGKYLSLTITIIAKNKRQLDSIYKKLNKHKLVVMTL